MTAMMVLEEQPWTQGKPETHLHIGICTCTIIGGLHGMCLMLLCLWRLVAVKVRKERAFEIGEN